jgi:putative inorganic carbon (HCO3(-)) transporter
LVKYLDYIIYWSMVIFPFSMAIAPAFTNIIMGFLIATFLIKKLIKKERLFTKTPINIPLLFFFLITCLSIVHSVDFKDTFKGGILRLLLYIFMLLVMVSEVRDKKQIGRIIFSITAGMILTFFNESWQVLTGKDFIRGYSPIFNIGLVRATSSFKDSNTLGIYLSAIAPIALGLGLYYFKNKQRIVFIIISIMALIGVALTYSRPTLLAVYIALFFLGLAKKNKLLISWLIVFTLISPFLLPKSVKGFAKNVNYNPLRFMCNDDRIAIYRNSLNMIKTHPVIGFGANTFMHNYRFYKESPEYNNQITSDYIYAHNNFLHMAAEIGLVGLGIFIWLLYNIFKESGNIYRWLEDNYLKVVCLSLIACVIAFLVNGLTESSLYSSRVAGIFWYLAGFLLALKKFAKTSEQP